MVVGWVVSLGVVVEVVVGEEVVVVHGGFAKVDQMVESYLFALLGDLRSGGLLGDVRRQGRFGVLFFESNQIVLFGRLALEANEVAAACWFTVTDRSGLGLRLGKAEQIGVFGGFGVVGRRREGFFGELDFGFGGLCSFGGFLGFELLEGVGGLLGFGVFALDVLVVDEFDYLVERGVDIGLPTLVLCYSVRLSPVSWCSQYSLRTLLPTCIF